MPRVPVYDTPQVALSTLPGARLSAPTAAAPVARPVDIPDPMPDVAGRQAQQIGAAFQSLGNVLGNRAAQLTQQVNQTRVGDAMNRLVKTDTDLQAEALQLQGRNALERPDGKSLPGEYGEKLQSAIDDISSTLGNEVQQLAFQQQAGHVKSQMYQRLTTHIIRQQDVFADESSQAQMATAIDRIGTLPDDEEAFQQSMGAIRASVDERVARHGGTQQMADVEFRKMADQAYVARYSAWGQADPVAALANFQANRNQISPLVRDRISDELFRTAAPQLVNAAKPWVTSTGAAPANAPDQANTPRGIRNNNPGNIVQTANQWQGEVQGNDPRFKTFATPEAGIKAMGDNLLAYQDKYGLNTIDGIVSRWAPATDNNDVGSYIATVSKALGVRPDDKLNLRDSAVMFKLVGAMIRHENGNQPYSDAQITTGINAALGKAALPAAAGQADYGYGNRQDGSLKGRGFLGELKRPDGGVMTEYSIGVEIDGKEMDIPTLVPTLTKNEINTLLTIKDGEPVPDDIVQKAVDHAKQRLAEGKGVFADNNPTDTPPVATTPAWRDPESKTGIPLVDNLPPEQRARVFSLAQSQAHQDMALVRDALQTRVQDAKAEYLVNGKAANPPSEAELIRAYGQVDGVQRYRDLQDTATLGVDLQRTKTVSNADMVKMLADEKPAPGDGFASRQRNYEILQRAVEQTMDARRKDPIAFAMQNPAFGFQPITDFANGQAVAQELGKRRDSMGRVASDYGTRPAVLTAKEAEAFGRFLAPLEVPDKARALGVIAASVGAPGMESISRQLGDKDNSLAIASMLAGRHETIKHHFLGFELSDDTQGPDAALLYLQGRDALAQKRAAIDETAETGIKAQIYQAIDGVYQTPQGRDAAAQAAFGIYAGLKAQGVDDVGRAVRIATGGIMGYNGGRIVKPYGWDDSRFEDAMADTVPERVRETDGSYLLGGVTLSASQLADALPAARLRSARDAGTYLVTVGADLVRLPDGAPFILQVP